MPAPTYPIYIYVLMVKMVALKKKAPSVCAEGAFLLPIEGA